MHKITLTLALILFCLQWACTSLPEKIASIQVGDHKSKVLDLLGSPHQKTRSQGMDVWVYHIYDKQGGRQSKAFTLKQGQVIEAKYLKEQTELDQKIEEAKDIESYEKSIKKKRQQRKNEFKDLKD